MEWLYNHVRMMIQQNITEPQSKSFSAIIDDATKLVHTQSSFKCRHPNCDKTYRYEKVRRNNEKKIYSPSVYDHEIEKEIADSPDDVFNYCTARVNLCLLWWSVDDAVKEGDGERIIRFWKYFLLYYKAYGHHKDAYAAFMLQAKIQSIYTEAQSEQII